MRRFNLKMLWSCRPLPLCRLRESRYYHLFRSDFSFPTLFSIFLCISTLSMSKTVNMKQRVFRSDFSCPRRIFYSICYCLCRSKIQRSHGPQIHNFGYVPVLRWSKQSVYMYKVNDVTNWLSQTTDNSKYFVWSPGLWDKESRLYSPPVLKKKQ